MNIRLKERHWQLGRHFSRFVDKRWFPNFKLNEENLQAFIKWESYGLKSLSNIESELVKPLLNGKINKELTLKMVIEECAEWWSSHNGWYYPIAHTIKTEFDNRSKDKLLLKALIKIMRDIKNNGFISVLSNFTGLTIEEKNRYINAYLK